MRVYAGRRGPGVSFGCIGSAVMLFIAATVIIALAQAAIAVIAIAVPAVLIIGLIRARRRRRLRRAGIRLYQAPRLRDGRARWVQRDRWPYAVRAGSRLDPARAGQRPARAPRAPGRHR